MTWVRSGLRIPRPEPSPMAPLRVGSASPGCTKVDDHPEHDWRHLRSHHGRGGDPHVGPGARQNAASPAVPTQGRGRAAGRPSVAGGWDYWEILGGAGRGHGGAGVRGRHQDMSRIFRIFWCQAQPLPSAAPSEATMRPSDTSLGRVCRFTQTQVPKTTWCATRLRERHQLHAKPGCRPHQPRGNRARVSS